jgi:hypothetical protein
MADGDIEAIERLKYAYFRHLDLKEFDQLGELLTEGCTASYEDGKTLLDGRAAIVDFLERSLGSKELVSSHFGHHPEITLTGPDQAKGVWYLQDRVLAFEYDLEIGGTAFYADEYEKIDGDWRISYTGYERVIEEHRVLSTLALTSVVTRFERD